MPANSVPHDIGKCCIINNPIKWYLDYDNPDDKPDQEELQFWRDFGRKD